MQSTLFRASSLFCRSVSRNRSRLQLVSSHRGYTGSRRFFNGFYDGSGKALILLGGITTITTVVALNNVSAQEDQDERNGAAKTLLKCFGLDDDDVVHWLSVFLRNIGIFVQQTQAKKHEEKKRAAKKILAYLKVPESQEKELLDKVCGYLKDNSDKGSQSTYIQDDCIINDAIHGPIELTPLLFQIINTPEFHRLKDVRQLGAAHYVYPGANHTRFDHSLGVCHLAGVFAKSLKEKIDKDAEKLLLKQRVQDAKHYEFDEREVLCVQLAGLCHDLGHGPFSHMFEHEVMDRLEDVKCCKHEELSVVIFKRMLVENPIVLAKFVDEGLNLTHVKLVEEMINPPKDPSARENPDRMFLYEIVANKTTGIDVDKWDYYARDCHYLGVQHDFQWRRCMHLAHIVKTPAGCEYEGENKLRIAFREKELDNIYGMFKTRVTLHQKAYQHKTIKAVERMIADAFLEVKDVFLIRVDDSKGESKSIKQAVEFACKKDPTKDDLKWYLALTDSIIGTIQCAAGTSVDQCSKLDKAQEILTRVKRRDLYSCLVRIPIPKAEHQCEDHLKNIQCKECSEGDGKLKVVQQLMDKDKKKRRQCVELFSKKICKDLPQFQPEDIWIKVVKIRLSSEGDDNPIKQVLFYRKSKSLLPEAISYDEVEKSLKKSVIPQALVEYDLRVYDKRKKEKRVPGDREKLQQATYEVLKEWMQ